MHADAISHNTGLRCPRRRVETRRLPVGGLLFAALAILLPLAGCDAITLIMSPTTVTVALVNESDYDVEVDILISDTQELTESLLEAFGDELHYTVPAGQTMTLSENCDDLQAIMIEDADLQVLGGLGPDADTDILRDGDDFGCGSTITFTFSHSQAIFDFDITTAVQTY